MKKTRTKHSAEFKTKVALEAIKEQKTLNELAAKYEVNPQQISNWKTQFLRRANEIFSTREPDKETAKKLEKLYSMIGQLEVENDWLKKKL
jgi:transposase-like protein